jgi:hypothetical protein
MPEEPTSTAAPEGEGAVPARHVEVHHVPAGGILVFERPDRRGPPIRELTAGEEVSVAGRRPPWVHIRAADGLDGWVDGTELAGIAVGAAPVAAHPGPEGSPGASSLTAPKVVEKQRSRMRLGTGPVLGALAGILAIVGTVLPWVQTVGKLDQVDAFGLAVNVLSGWDHALKGGFELGLLIVILAGVGAVVSLVSGGGIVRRVLGLALMIICVVYVLQTQDLLTTSDRGLGTGLNVWDLVDYGVLVTFGGGLVMLGAPSR